MRSTLTISLPETQLEELKQKAKKHGFISISEYFRFLGNLDEGLISKEELLKFVKQAERDYKKGKLKKARPLADFI